MRQPSGTRTVVATLGLLQILAWGSTFYLLSVLGKPIAADTGWPYAAVIGGLSLALLMASVISPFVGRRIAMQGGRTVLATGSCLIALGLAGLAIFSLFASLLGRVGRHWLWHGGRAL